MSLISQLSRQNYRDPILSSFTQDISTSEILDITESFSKQHAKITSNCHKALKIYKKLLGVQYQLNSWEFLTLKTSIDLNFSDTISTQTRKFDIKIATNCIERCNKLDDELEVITGNIDTVKLFISGLSIEEYISDPGCLVLKIYFKLLNLQIQLNENLSISYTKAKLLVILYELTQILVKLNDEVTPLVRDNTDYQSTLTSYKNFISVLIGQLDTAIEQKDSEQIQECLGILNDVEKMYESVRINFEFLNEELYEFDLYSEVSSPKALQYEEEDYLYSKPHSSRSRRTSISSTTSSLARHSFVKTTLSEEMPYLLHAFDEAKHLEQELSEYQQKPSSPSPSPPPTVSTPSMASSILSKAKFNDKRGSHLTAGISSNIGFSNTLLNNIYGLHPNPAPSTGTKGFKTVLSPHNEVD